MPENEDLRAGSFDALICTVGHTYISPMEKHDGQGIRRYTCKDETTGMWFS
jgi:hypothetical protein